MSNQSILSIVGYVVGGAYGYPQLGAIVGGVVGAQIDANKIGTSKIDDLKAPKISFGAPINHVFGHPRHGGNLIWVSDAIENGETGGGKKGAGGVMNYIRHVLVLLGEQRTAGPIRKIWVAGKLVYSVAEDADDETVDASVEDAIFGQVIYYDGQMDQMPDDTYESFVGIGNAPAYRGRPTTLLMNINCGASGQLPVFTFETAGQYAAENIGKTTLLRKAFAESDHRASPPEGSSSGGVKVVGISGPNVVVTRSDTGTAESVILIPAGYDTLRPGSGNGNKAVHVFGSYGQGAKFAVAGEGGLSVSVLLDDPNDLIGTQEIRFSIWKDHIAVGSTMPYGATPDPESTSIYYDPLPGEGVTLPTNKGFVYVYKIAPEPAELIIKIPYIDSMASVNSIAMSLSRVWIFGDGVVTEWDRTDSYNQINSFGMPPGSGHRIFVSQEGSLCCANSSAGIFKWTATSQTWDVFTVMDDYVPANADSSATALDLGTNNCHHVVRGSATYAVETTRVIVQDAPELFYVYLDSNWPGGDGTVSDATHFRNSWQDVANEIIYINGGVPFFTPSARAGRITVSTWGSPSGYRAWQGGSIDLINTGPFSVPYNNYPGNAFYDITYHFKNLYGYPGDSSGAGMADFQANLTIYRWGVMIPPGQPDPKYYVNVYRKRRDVDLLDLTEPTLQVVVENLCQRAGYLPEQIDASELATKYVHAFAITQNGSTSSPLQLLADVYGFFCVESEGVLIFKFYGAGSVREIPFYQLGASFSNAVTNPYPFARTAEREQPSTRGVHYVNLDNDYQDGMESSDQLLDSIQSSSVADYSIGLHPDEAKQLAIITQQVAQASLIRVGPLSLGPQHRDLEPGDVLITYKKNGDLVQIFPQRITYDRGLVTLEGTSYDAAAYTSDAVTSNEYATAVTVRPPPDTDGEIFDPPLFADQYDGPSFWVAAKPVGFPWPGYAEKRSPDDLTYAELYRSNFIGIFGTCETTLADWDGPNVIDPVSRVTVNIGSSQLSSVSRIALLTSRQNLAMIGSEMIQFQRATLIDTGIYVLSNLIRYVAGTEWMTHSAEERFVLIQPDRMNRVAINYADVGLSRFYKHVSLGRPDDKVEPETFAPQVISMKPLAPCNAHALRRANRDILIRWHRRTRFQTNALRGIVPLDYSINAFYLEVFDGAHFLRLIDVNNTNQATYSLSDQEADGLGSADTLTFKIRQRGNVEGYPATVTLE